MKELILHTVTVFMGFFAIMNPIANIPIFLSLTADKINKRFDQLRFVLFSSPLLSWLCLLLQVK
jgi:multiple antibiotic resistance protein